MMDGTRAAPSTMDQVARFVLGMTPDTPPASARECAAYLLLDALGMGIASAPMEAGVIARQTASLLCAGSEPH